MGAFQQMCVSPCSWYVLALVLVCMTHMCGTKTINDDRFMTHVNLEHYYVIEENVLNHADLLLRDNYFGADEEETDEEHEEHAVNLTDFRTIVTETKAIHREAGLKLQQYLAHPVNVYHMFRRLSTKWKDTLDVLLKTKPCRKWDVPKITGRLEYLRTSLPGEGEVERMIRLTSLLQKIHKLNAADVSEGKLGSLEPQQPLSLEDQYRFVNVFKGLEDMRTALVWLQQMNKKMKSGKSGQTVTAELAFNRTNVLQMMASAQYYLKHVEDAVKTTEELVKIEPGNSIARNNLNFFKNKLKTAKPDDGKQVVKYSSKFERRCAKAKRYVAKRKTCSYIRLGLDFVKVEVIRKEPKVVMFHDVIDSNVADTLKDYAHDTQTDMAWKGDEKYFLPDVRVPLAAASISRYGSKMAARNLGEVIQTLKKAVGIKSKRQGLITGVNIGLAGMNLTDYDKKLGVVKPVIGQTGAFFAFLNGAEAGGEIVFPGLKIAQQPSKGSVLFYYTSENAIHSHCPVLGSSLWVAILPVYEDPKNFCTPEDEWIL